MNTTAGPSIDEIIQKINSLERLSTDPAATIHEASAAAAAIQRLLFTYNLTMYEVRLNTKGEAPKYDQFKFDMGAKNGTINTLWRRILLIGLCKTNFCRDIAVQNENYCFVVGSAENVEVVHRMFNWLVEELLTAKKAAWTAYTTSNPFALESKGNYLKFYRSFLEQAALTIEKRLVEIFDAQKVETVKSTALVVQVEKEVKDAFDKMFPSCLSKRMTTDTQHPVGRAMGKQAGESVQLQTHVK